MPGESRQLLYKFDDSSGYVMNAKILLGKPISSYVEKRVKQVSGKLGLEGDLGLGFIFVKELQKFFKNAACTISFTAVNYNGELTSQDIKKSCDFILPYFREYADIAFRHRVEPIDNDSQTMKSIKNLR